MGTFNAPGRKNQNRTTWSILVVIALLIGIIAWLLYRFKDEKQFAVVKLYGKGAAINLSKNYNFAFFSNGNKNKGALLAEEGDLLGLNNTFIHFTQVKNDSMQVDDEGDSLVFINGKINTIVISDKADLLPWFRTMKAADISQLRTIYFDSKIPDSYIPYLKEIARLQPAASLVFEKNDSLAPLIDYLERADFFSPRFVNVSVTQDKFARLAHWKTIECLYLDLPDSVVTTALPAMPALKQCILYGDHITAIDPSFFSNNTQLEKVALLTPLPGYGLLEPLHNLEELTVNNQENDADMTALKNIPGNLSVLILSGNYTHIDSLTRYKKLRWLGLPANTSQQQFNTITAQLPRLQVLEITGSHSIPSLVALQEMPELRGLVITDTVTDKQSLYALKKLRYLSLPQNNQSDSVYLQSMEKALPGCIVVPNSGACLGSGWLLLLVPLTFLLAFVVGRRIEKRFSKDNSHEVS